MDNQLLKELQRTGKFMMDKDLAWGGTAGNISEEATMVI